MKIYDEQSVSQKIANEVARRLLEEEVIAEPDADWFSEMEAECDRSLNK